MSKSQKKSESSHEIAPFWRGGWPDIDRAFDNFKRDFERSLSSFPALNIPSLSTSSMSCDIIDEGDRFVLHADMPGIEKEDVKLNVTDNAVEISAYHKKEQEEKKKNYVRKERKEVSYYRTLLLPEKVDSSKTKAKMNNGILNVEIPKITPTPKPKSKSIQVQ